MPGAQQPERLLGRVPVVRAPQQIAIFHRITNLEFMYLLYDLPIQKVLRHPVNITYIFSALELAKVIESVRIYSISLA